MLPSDYLAAEEARPFGEDFPNLESLSTGPWWTRPANQTTPLKNGRRAAPPNLNVPRDQVVVFALYTHQANVLKLTAQLYPLLPEEARDDELRVSATATHAGVLDFAAPDGHVGVPPKTMLSLVRGVPEVAERLAKGELRVRCRAVRLPTPKESSCALRPVAEGFHHGGADEAAVDLGAVLTKELGRGRHCCLTLGDWIAVSHDDRTVRLVVAALQSGRCASCRPI